MRLSEKINGSLSSYMIIILKESESPDKQTILSRIFARYPDISEEDEDYLNSLPLDGLINELKNRGWNDILDEE